MAVVCELTGLRSDAELYQRIEKALGMKLDAYPAEKEEVMVFKTRVEEAQREAKNEMKSLLDDRGNKGSVLKGHRKRKGVVSGRDHMDAEEG